MSASDNPFLIHLDNYPRAGAEDIKRLFRILAKRTHPDTGADDAAAFVDLQRAYHEALTAILDRPMTDAAGTAQGGVKTGNADEAVWVPSTPRERVLHLLYRYKAHLPAMALSSTPLPAPCLQTFAGAVDAASAYAAECRETLKRFDDQFHRNRAVISRYPDILTKYRCFLQGFASFFDYIMTPNQFNDRVARSYFSEIHPVTDYDPTTSPSLRTNRSAPARAALFRFSTWLIAEMERGPCRIV